MQPPLSDSIITALARLIDDSQVETREPSHSTIQFHIDRAKLSSYDPGQQSNKPVGKSKRIRGVLSSALTNNVSAGGILVGSIISTVQGCGGFRRASANYCGEESINNLIAAFATNGWDLGLDGSLQPQVLENLSNKALTSALRVYAERARRGALDSPLLTGTAKDFLEAVAAHVLVQKWGSYSNGANFPSLLGQAFTALGLATSATPPNSGEPAKMRVERAAYDLACSLNALRNKEGTGHGRPWLSEVTSSQARFAIESMGNIASLLLDTMEQQK